MNVDTGETRTLAPTFVQAGSPNDVTPATRRPAGVLTNAGPPESPSQAPLRSVWSYTNWFDAIDWMTRPTSRRCEFMVFVCVLPNPTTVKADPAASLSSAGPNGGITGVDGNAPR